METLAKLLRSLLGCPPRTLGAIMIAMVAGIALWTRGPRWLSDALSNPASYAGVLTIIALLCCAGLITYPIEGAGKYIYRRWKNERDERDWRKGLQFLTVPQKHNLQGYVEQKDRPCYISPERWRYILEHPEVIDTPSDPRTPPHWSGA